ncbi:NADH dehydrogenase 1 alpha subcomplex [Thecamonas trahens ATCC 50062]|uniref:NADH dehydrogenase 1 alpha subcomplex n=1 Tax=Thecamonas trahens ATCC 50062 TaxID=461836 RepID=A0A0L0DSY5_THETB|nr:NADH dehydrogenase 1 alpha subcomplex [Thecamonas trahens ATCC 50062]KNC55464.1 NADH dehydrogenase 1 alpha subcomplex [Thecamonas trahens ATCC 50062]|eukprot:XP_013761245.1 NADH dehydrogenase 1 alpha subcomplex [Thecamonas trahens ATCC 50062]
MKAGPALPQAVVRLTAWGGWSKAEAEAAAEAGTEIEPLEMGSWMVVTDETIQGSSRATAEAVAGDGPGYEAHVVFKGELSTTPAPGYDRSGFASFRTVPGTTVPSLEYYDAFEIVCRGDGRPYQFNVGCESVVPDDLHQAALPTHEASAAADWAVVRIPFDALIMTWRGFVQVEQLKLDSRRITSLGFTLADGVDGPFELAIRDIRAIRMADADADAGDAAAAGGGVD